MRLNEMAKLSHDNAHTKGFYDEYYYLKDKIGDDERAQKFLRQIWLSHRMMLIVSELGEALEGVRDSNFSIDPKSGGLGEELVDTAIRLTDLFEHAIGSDFESAVEKKMKYNASRPFKHGRSL